MSFPNHLSCRAETGLSLNESMAALVQSSNLSIVGRRRWNYWPVRRFAGRDPGSW